MKAWYFFGTMDMSGVTGYQPERSGVGGSWCGYGATTYGERGAACWTCRLVRIIGSAGVRFDAWMTREVA